MKGFGAFFIIYFIILIIFSILMVYGIQEDTRGWMMPWLVAFAIVCLFQLIFGLWLLGGYYIYVKIIYLILSQLVFKKQMLHYKEIISLVRLMIWKVFSG